MSPIARDLGDLPPDEPVAGEPPDRHPRFVTALATAWHQAYVAGGNEDRAFAVDGVRFRASWASKCARDLAYSIRHRDAQIHMEELLAIENVESALLAPATEAILRLAPSNPPSLADAWRMGLGSMVHAALDETITNAFPEAEVEVSVDLNPDVNGAGTVDIVVRHADAKVTVIELKTINGFGYKASATRFKGPAEGPRTSAKVQAALSANALDADEVVIGYLSLECLSPDVAGRNGLDDIGRFAAEWTYPREVYKPWAEAEIRRVNRVMTLLDEGKLAPRMIPDPAIPVKAEITDPSTGAWQEVVDGQVVNAGKTWHCGYCWNRDRCIQDGPGIVAVDITPRRAA